MGKVFQFGITITQCIVYVVFPSQLFMHFLKNSVLRVCCYKIKTNCLVLNEVYWSALATTTASSSAPAGAKEAFNFIETCIVCCLQP